MKVIFLADHRPAGQAENRPSYKKGETYDFEGSVAEGYARKYISRGLAEEVRGDEVRVRVPKRKKVNGIVPEPVEIMSRQVNGAAVLYAAKPWPQVAVFSKEVVAQDSDNCKVDGTRLTLTFANGIAEYKLQDYSDDTVAGVLIDSTYDPVPEEPKSE